MEYVQERFATLHDLTGAVPEAPLGRTAVVVPMTGAEVGEPAAEHTLSVLGEVDPAVVIVAVRTPVERVDEVRRWLRGFDAPIEFLWCNAPAVDSLLAEAGLGGEAGKGRDVWLALGVASERAEYVVVHDADATSYTDAHVPRLAAPLAEGFAFTKGYYARVERDGLYGRLFRLFYVPVVTALGEWHDEAILEFLGSFRYALAGEFGLTADLARRLRAQRSWGLEVGTLGEVFATTGFEGTAQVDLGFHEHDHRSVGGTGGLASMSRQVGDALFRVVEDADVDPDYDRLDERYRTVADRLVDQYAADARFNRVEYDPDDEREQVEAYAEAIAPPGPDDRLPAWVDAPIEPEAVRTKATVPLQGVGSTTRPY